MQNRESDPGEGIGSKSRQSVRRKLFQDDDDNDEPRTATGINANYNNDLIEEHKKELEEKKKRWNFDFQKEEPLPGHWEWRKVVSESNARSQETNLENNQETDGTDLIPEKRENHENFESDSDNLPEN